ncbi:MAG: hypothetical protein ACKVTZ_03540 [Bacteroidia bacterium]
MEGLTQQNPQLVAIRLAWKSQNIATTESGNLVTKDTNNCTEYQGADLKKAFAKLVSLMSFDEKRALKHALEIDEEE